jgi:ketosteroid isomerase-like protein
MTHEQILALGRRWADAERRGDVAALDALLADDFVAVGPRGFVLHRQQWLDRYRPGNLTNEAFSWQDIAVRDYGEVAIAVGVQAQQASFQGHDASGRYRLTQIVVRQAQRWLIAGLHLSGPIPDAPPSRA